MGLNIEWVYKQLKTLKMGWKSWVFVVYHPKSRAKSILLQEYPRDSGI